MHPIMEDHVMYGTAALLSWWLMLMLAAGT